MKREKKMREQASIFESTPQFSAFDYAPLSTIDIGNRLWRYFAPLNLKKRKKCRIITSDSLRSEWSAHKQWALREQPLQQSYFMSLIFVSFDPSKRKITEWLRAIKWLDRHSVKLKSSEQQLLVNYHQHLTLATNYWDISLCSIWKREEKEYRIIIDSLRSEWSAHNNHAIILAIMPLTWSHLTPYG